MQSVTVKEIYRETDQFLNQKVELSGWVRTVRSSKAFGFIEINDGSFFENIQVVFEESLANFTEIGKLTISSALRIQGTLVPSPGAKQPFELKAELIEILSLSSADYPLQKKRHTFEYLRTIAHLRPRKRILLLPSFECVPWLPTQFISSFRKKVMSMCILQLLQEVMLRVQGKCLG